MQVCFQNLGLVQISEMFGEKKKKNPKHLINTFFFFLFKKKGVF